MKQDVTSLFEDFREHARHLRNTAFDTRAVRDLDSLYDILTSFEIVQNALFETLVVRKLPGPERPSAPDLLTSGRFRIEPAGLGMKVFVARDAGVCGYWDHPVTELFPGDTVIAFRGYFDWDQQARIDLRYCRGRIVCSTRWPEITEHDLLVETSAARLWYEWDE